MSEHTENTALEKTQTQAPQGVEHTRERDMFIPRASIYETDDEFVVMADLPDVRPDAVDITVEENVLRIHGRVTDHRPEGYSLAYQEYEVGDYHREFSLPDKIDADRIAASMDRGVLSLTLPKLKPAHRRIEVTAGAEE